MKKLIDEFRRGWQGISQPSLLFSTAFAAGCLVLSTIARWGVAQIRPDVFFTPYFPAVFLAAAVGGARLDGRGCDIKDMLHSELGPYGHVRFNLNGDPLFLPAKLAVSLALIFHELATNAGRYGAFSSARGLLQVSWSVSENRLNLTWDETEGPVVDNVGPAGFGTKLLQSALRSFDGKTEIRYLKTGVHCTMQCRLPAN